MGNRVLLIMRGLPGSGKSHFASNVHDYTAMLPNVQIPEATPKVASADNWFQTEDGWKRDPAQLSAAHNDCFCNAMRFMREDRPLVVVDNTNMTRHEISPYMMLGTAMGYEVVIVHVTPPRAYVTSGPVLFDVLAQRNVHGVPEAAIRRMAERLETLPPYWCEVLVTM